MVANIKNIDLEPFQARFFESRARFPAFVAGWGTGKTMVGILKGVLLSSIYNNNLGLIVRKKFTDLRDSTLKDFERYTGLHVPQGTKEITLPGTDSVIMFRHGEELSGLQNVNLGWFMIEQGEEFDTAEQFDLLRGRLRRELEVNQDYEPGAFPELIEYLKSDPQRLGMIISNANGHNWIWREWIKLEIEGREIHEASTFENKANLPADFIKDLRTMEINSPRKYKRYVLNSHDEYDIEGSIYGEWLDTVREEKRICKVPHDTSGAVHTAWDLGIGDSTAIWFFQLIGQEIHIIDYYECRGEGIAHYAKVLDDKRSSEGYIYGTHYAPFDINKRELSTGQTLYDTAWGLGIEFDVLDRAVLEGGIELVRQILPRCWFDQKRTDAGMDCLINYKWKKLETMSTEDRAVYASKPLHDWTSHGADAFRYLATAVQDGIVATVDVTTRRRVVDQYRPEKTTSMMAS